VHGGLGGETVAPGMLALTGNSAAVDRVRVELRTAPAGPAVAVVHGLLQRDGHVVDVNRDGMVKYAGANNDRDLVLIAIGGTVPTNTLSGQYRMEDINLDGTVKYSGTDNDRDIILQAIGGTVPTATLSGQYRSEDLNLDGVVKYSCAGNDREIILQTIGGMVPTAVRIQQMP
jgi:hypothetical protein